MKTIDAIRLSLSHPSAEFARGRTLQPALARYEMPTAVLEALALSSPLTAAERDTVTLALIAEHQRGRRPVWQSILLVAYEPMLCGVWKRLINKRDAEARLVLAFLESIADIAIESPPSVLALHLRHAVERRVFGSTAVSRIEPEVVSLSAARRTPSPESVEAHLIASDQMRRIRESLESLFGDLAGDVLDVLVHARTGRAPLLAFIDERNPGTSARERARIFERLEPARRRALLHLERRFGAAAVQSLFLAA